MIKVKFADEVVLCNVSSYDELLRAI